jgi:ribosomal protein S18 acetylase RimI-like enzyme
MSSVAIRRRPHPSGLRPVDPARDMGAVADLIQAAFADDLDQAGYSMLREMRHMGRLGPLLWWFNDPGAGLNQVLSGFVWLEDGQVIGNVTVTQASHAADRWIISNVAVAKPHRGRGIARRLMNAAIGVIDEWRGKVVTLQVRDDNAAALHLYQTMGFRVIFGSTHMRLDAVTSVPLLPLPGTQLRTLRNTDAEMSYQLARAATPEVVQAEHPIRLAHYQLGLERRFADWFRTWMGGPPAVRLAAVVPCLCGGAERGDRLEATIVTEPAGRSESQIALTVHPEQRGRIEKHLISHMLHQLSQKAHHSVVARHPTYHPEGIEAFRSFGFRTERTLLWMRREMS